VPEGVSARSEATPSDPDLLARSLRLNREAGGSGKRSVVLSDSRGRYVKPMLPPRPCFAPHRLWMPRAGRRPPPEGPAAPANPIAP